MLPPPDEALKIVVTGDSKYIRLFPMKTVLNYVSTVEWDAVEEIMKYTPEDWYVDIAVTHLLAS